MSGHPLHQRQQPVAASAPVRRPGRNGARVSLAFAKDPYRLLIFFVIIMTLSRIHNNFGFLRPFRPALTLTALAGMYAYLNPRYLSVNGLFKTWPARIVLALCLMACLSVPFGISMGGSASFVLFEFSKTLLLTFLVIAAIRNASDLYTMVWAVAASAGCLSYLSIFVFRMRKASDDGLLRIQMGYSYDSNDIGLVVLVGLVLTLLLVQTASSKGKLISIWVIFGIGVTIAKTGSRGAMVGLVCVTIALLVMLTHVRLDKRIGTILVMGLGLLLAAPEGYWEQMKTILNPEDDYNMTAETGRKAVALRGLGYMLSHPATGIGIDNFPRAEGTISDIALARQDNPNAVGIKWSAAHNSFVQVGAELGIPGLILFCVLVFGGIVSNIRLRRRLPKHWIKGDAEERFLYFTAVYLPVAFIAFATAGVFVSFAYMDLVYILAALTAGLIVSVEAKLHGTGAPALAPRSRHAGFRTALHPGGLPPGTPRMPPVPPAQPPRHN